MHHSFRLIGLVWFALVCLSIPAVPSRAITSNRIFLPMISTPLPDFVFVVDPPLTPTDLYIGFRDGRQYQLTNTPDVGEFSPTWSPDHSQIAYALHVAPEQPMFLMLTSVARPESPQQVLEVDGFLRDLEWSPIGTRIVFVVQQGYFDEIYSVNVDGTDLQRLTNGLRFIASPTWSPDGTRIAFSALNETSVSRLFVMNADGSNMTQLPPVEHGHAYRPTWSPDGTRLAYDTWRRVYTMRPDGSEQTLISTVTADNIKEYAPNWSLDSQYLVFSRYSPIQGNIVMTELATGNETVLPFEESGVQGFVWAR